jgi:Mrp family chromosome partitioning ATPase
MRATFWLRVGVGAAVGLGAGLVALALTPSVYAAQASVLVESVGPEVNLRTEAELVRSTQTMTDANARMTGDPAHPDAVGRLTGVEAVDGTSLLVISFEAATAEAARAGAMAYAEAYLAAREQTAQAALDDQISAVLLRLDDVRGQLDEVNRLIATLDDDGPDVASLRSTQAALTAQSASLTSMLNELQTTSITAGRIVAQAQAPASPVRPSRLLYLGVSGSLGLVSGAVLDVVARRWSRRIRQGDDLGRHRGVPLLADLEPAALVTGVGPTHPSGQAFNRLRNEIIAALTPSDRTILITAAAPGSASLLVAANLAAAFARADNDVVLVGASVADLATPGSVASLASVFDLADVPGLTDVLTGRTSLSRALQRASRSPRLQVVTPGGTASAAGLLQSEGARAVLQQLAAKNRYVIVDAPSTAVSADAQSLAGAADVAVIVVEIGNAHHTQVADAATQLARVGARLLGAIVVPRVAATGLPTPERSDSGRRSAGQPDYDTEAWIGTGKEPLDGPTTKLHPVNRRIPATDEAPRDLGHMHVN